MTSNLSNDADNTSDTIWIRLVAATSLSYCYFDDISIHGTPITWTPTESTKAPTFSTSCISNIKYIITNNEYS